MKILHKFIETDKAQQEVCKMELEQADEIVIKLLDLIARLRENKS